MLKTISASMLTRVATGAIANGFAQLTTIAIQLATLPVFLACWDLESYGKWLIISAVPSYLSAADAGLVTETGNRMTAAIARGHRHDAVRVFQSSFAALGLICLSIEFAVLLLGFGAHQIALIDSSDVLAAILALSTGVLMTHFGGLAECIYRAEYKYHVGVLLSSVARILEFLGLIAGLMLRQNFASVAIGGLVGRMLGLCLLLYFSKRAGSSCYWSLNRASTTEAKSILRSSVWFLALPLANALSIQSVTILTGYILGPASVALLNSYRTLSRVLIQLTSVVSHALWPEFTRLDDQKDQRQAVYLLSRSLGLAAVYVAILSGILHIATPTLLQYWTHGSVAYDRTLSLIMLVYAAVASLAHIPRVFLLATGSQARVAINALAIAALTLLSTAIGAHYVGNSGIALSMALGEGLFLIYYLSLATSHLRSRMLRAA